MGPQGPAGAQGAQGPQGPKGDTGPAGAGRLAFFGDSNGSSLSSNGTRYVGVGQVPDATESNVSVPWPLGGTINGLQVRLSDSPGAGRSYSFTLVVNGALTGATCTISGGTAVACSSAAQVSVSAGQTVSLRANPSGTPVARTVKWSFYGTE
jgi:hypothetical protein